MSPTAQSRSNSGDNSPELFFRCQQDIPILHGFRAQAVDAVLSTRTGTGIPTDLMNPPSFVEQARDPFHDFHVASLVAIRLERPTSPVASPVALRTQPLLLRSLAYADSRPLSLDQSFAITSPYPAPSLCLWLLSDLRYVAHRISRPFLTPRRCCFAYSSSLCVFVELEAVNRVMGL